MVQEDTSSDKKYKSDILYIYAYKDILLKTYLVKKSRTYFTYGFDYHADFSYKRYKVLGIFIHSFCLVGSLS
jgi:hypothetical protein